MYKAVKKSTLVEMEGESDVNELAKDLSRDLELEHDFVWVDNSSCESIMEENHLDNYYPDITDVAQHGINKDTENAGVLLEDNTEHVDDLSLITSHLDKGLVIEQQYWEPIEAIVERVSRKYPATQRLTLKDYNIIANAKATVRDPSFYQFDKFTTELLENIRDKKYFGTGPYYNIVGKGENSVVIYSFCPWRLRRHFQDGHAVKVYKLGSDSKKNNLVLKRAQREYDHLQILHYPCFSYVPSVVYKNKNVLVMGLVGTDQEPAPTLNSEPIEDPQSMYDTIVGLMDKWYKKLNLVHGKLSKKNIRYYRNKPTIIGWGHSVRTNHPSALKKLLRDCHFVTKFFEKRDVKVKSTEELFRSITGADKLNKKLLEVIQGKNLWDKQLSNPNRVHDSNTAKQRVNSRFK